MATRNPASYLAQEWKRRASANVRNLTKDEALAVIHRINATGYGYTIEQPEIRKLTGGFVSQSINHHVMRLLGKRAGILKCV